MKIDAVAQLTALSHPTRLAVFRLLMRRYPDAVPAGEIAGALTLKASTLSVYLSILTHAGLIEPHRHGTARHYRIVMGTAQDLMGFLFLDCCGGRADLCAPPPQIRNVLFICTRNSARSIMAQAILRDAGAGRFTAHSAGTHPGAVVSPMALDVLRANGHATDGLTPKPLSAVPAPDLVITLCDTAANEGCPRWPGQPVAAHWGLPAPGATGTPAAYAATYATLAARIRALSALPPAGLDRLTLQSTLDTLATQEAPS